MPRGKNLIVGVTGGMGCGKSTAAGFFAEAGFLRFDSDEYIRDTLYKDPAVISAVRQRFGPEVAPPDDSVRRDRIAEIVFAEPAALEWLEGLLHPRLYDRWAVVFAEGSGRRWVVEVPLLFEKGLENWFDFTVCVTADSGLQLRRLEQRGISPKLALQRVARQMPLAQKCELADFVLLNDGTPEFLREQVNELAGRLMPKVPAK